MVGNGRCPIIDTWWQTETGAHMIAPLEGVSPVKPGSAGLPFFGVEPCVLDEQGRELQVIAGLCGAINRRRLLCAGLLSVYVLLGGVWMPAS